MFCDEVHGLCVCLVGLFLLVGLFGWVFFCFVCVCVRAWWGLVCSFPPDGRCDESYSETRLPPTLVIRYIFDFFGVVTLVIQTRPAGDVISTLESLVQCFKL